MPRIAVVNMAVGFFLLCFAAMGGSFIAFDMTEGYLKDPEILASWQLALQKSSHGHTNLFAIVHVVMGLTMPYSLWSNRTKVWQTWGLAAGSFAMGPMMLVRAAAGPTSSLDPIGLVIGAGLSLSFAALGCHLLGLMRKVLEK